MAEIRATWHGAKVLAAKRAGTRRGVRLAGEHLLDESRKIVPIETGHLQNSAGVDSDDEAAHVYYDTPYAVIQHEQLDYWHKAGRSAKYLEGPFLNNAGVFQRLIAESIRSQLGG